MNKVGASAIGIDVGGTSTRVGLVDAAGHVKSSRSFPTPESYDALLRALMETARAWCAPTPSNEHAEPTCIGLALPALFDRATARIRHCVNLPFLEGQSLSIDLSGSLGRQVQTVTDAEAATWAEYQAIGSPNATFAHLRLGTGVALGVVRSGRLLNLADGRSGHLPELVIDESPGAPMCPCGRRGCLEVFVSAARSTETDDAKVSVDALAVAVAKAIAKLRDAFDIDTITIGGGLLIRRPALCARTCDVIKNTNRLSGLMAWPGLIKARCGDAAGVVGAALLALNPQHAAYRPKSAVGRS